MAMPPWEHGSEYHWLAPTSVSGCEFTDAIWLSSGRDAIRFLIDHGRKNLGWRRFMVPTYLCQEVVGAVVRTGIRCESYPDRPGERLDLGSLGLSTGDVVLVVNQLGLRSRPSGIDPASRPFHLVEDHTHDPWSRWCKESTADFCLASLRKCLPVPDGSPVWSPRGHELPEAPPLTEHREHAALRKLEGMLLKTAYLQGCDADKDAFRRVSLAGEAHIADGDVSAATAIGRFRGTHADAKLWRDARRRNWIAFRDALGPIPGVELLTPTAPQGASFSAVLRCETRAHRDTLRAKLISSNIYPAILWPLELTEVEGIQAEDLALSRRILSVHCDGRYSAEDMSMVARKLRDANLEASSP